ncbi:MAG: cell division protein FtsH [Candidatus Woykebacteria bacterium RBG_16_43_9]|uniref:ATP-dependent zinc metalloprotease FtsH n=1 Tax=Candidatus Woykebacteria bacterium RBG_16_43_9 TaxID=1802596 RepID=A0A1G1WDA3_9BACT|nr:MAG: cell division protein FtsH [Candidatus Woykebacteria bacterium RBG_16_43_9]
METLKKQGKNQNILRTIILYIVLAVIATVIIVSFLPSRGTTENKKLSEVLTLIKEEKVKEVQIDGSSVSVELEDGKKFKAIKEEEVSFAEILKDAEIDPKSFPWSVKDTSSSRAFLNIALAFLPVLIIVGFFYFFLRQARGAGENILSFARSKAKTFNKDKPSAKFPDVAGVEEAKQELKEVVQFLKHPEKFRALGAKIPKGVLLVGPAGVGKTLLARAVAGEADVPFYSIAGSEFMEMLVGVGASRARDLFDNAKKSAPAIIFIDEIDAIGRHRGLGIGGGHDEREQTLNQILVEMDGFEPNDNVIVMAATNRPDMLDPALVRPGRFDRRVVLDLPDIEGRKAIMKIHTRNKPLSPDVDLDKIAKRTVGFSGADLENMLNEAAILAARGNKKQVQAEDMEEAAIKVQLGPERKRMTTDEEKLMTAYHEAGHALVTKILPHTDPVHRISIVARGPTGGHTLIPPTVDRYNETKTRLIETITSLLGGRAAEEIEFKEFTVGAASDIQRATEIARKMVTEFGMSSLGPLTTGVRGENPWLARELGDPKPLSEHLAARVDDEIKKIIDASFEEAKRIIRKNREKLDLVASELIKRETLEGDEFEELIERGEKLHQVKEQMTEKKLSPTKASENEETDKALVKTEA